MSSFKDVLMKLSLRKNIKKNVKKKNIREKEMGKSLAEKINFGNRNKKD